MQLEVEMKELHEKQVAWDAVMEKVAENRAKAPKKIKLDVGGKTFTTSKDTLLQHENTFFYAMLSSDQWKPDEDGVYFIDRDPSYFHHVMEHMRSGNTRLKGLDNYQILKVREEFDYYQIDLPFSPCAWNTDVGVKHISYAEEGNLVTRKQNGCGWDSNCISKYAVTQFKVEVVNDADIMIGFIKHSEFSEYGDNTEYDDPSASCLYVHDGTLWGGGKSGEDYASAIQVGQTIECSHEPTQETISFSVDGFCTTTNTTIIIKLLLLLL